MDGLYYENPKVANHLKGFAPDRSKFKNFTIAYDYDNPGVIDP